MKNSKKGFYRTLEVLIAIVLTFLFVAFFIPQFTETEQPLKPSLNILPRLEQNDEFRSCAVGDDADCLESKIEEVIPLLYGYKVSVSNDVNYEETDLPSKDIYIESIFIGSNVTQFNPKIVKLYYWRK